MEILFVVVLFIILVSLVVYASLKPKNSLASGWGNYYAENLSLSSAEKDLLNKISTQIRPDAFYKVAFCRENAIRLFLSVYRKFPSFLIGSKYFDLFYYCSYILKIKYVFLLPSNDVCSPERAEVKRFESVIADSVRDLIEKEFLALPELDAQQERLLYGEDSKRWLTIFEKLKADFSDGIQFYEDIKGRVPLSGSVVAKRNLCYDSYSFMLDKDKVLALKFYMHYLDVGSASDTFKFKTITKPHQKILFENETQLKYFQKILKGYKKNENLNKALSEIEDLFVKKRKKVLLDENAIKSAKEDLIGVVGLLNEYLEDDEFAEVKVTPVMESVVSSSSISIDFNIIQIEFLEMFVFQSYILSFAEVDVFANSKGVFKSQLIDGINDLCYDLLDDMLIEEAEDNYILNEQYYKKVMEG
ncbi:TerB-like protein [Dysgonomonas alginatilytica]|uniref:TerB-like protein n=1 Tax=Dysgonomonas alginatilytica TaxID=1605892 RepID=A0A2V3PTY4_9BACT|nr:tellurite resistance TerB C-terminal domain-containing protein [Dysgonomonas alginatilytica]PXV67367.1 TerB-like protein [Dysgonomonas alginatilytica]